MTKAPDPPPGWKFDAFADVRQGKSLFEMRRPEDWLVRADEPKKEPRK